MHVRRKGRDVNAPGDCNVSVRSLWDNSLVLIGDITVSPSSGYIGSLWVFNKQQSISPDKIRDTQKMNTYVDRKLPDDPDSVSIFGKVIGRELFHGSSAYLYLCCWMDLVSNVVRTEAPKFVDLGLPEFNTLDEFGIQGTPATRMRRPIYGSHLSVPDHVFGKATEVGMSTARSEQDYSYKTDFDILRGNQDFGCQNISMSPPPLDSAPIGTNMTNGKTSQLESIPIGVKMPEPTPQTRPTEFSKQKVKAHVPADPESYPSSSDSSSSESDLLDDRIFRKSRIKNKSDFSDDRKYRESKSKKFNTNKSVRNTRNRTHRTHRRVILIRLTTVIIDAIYA